MSIHSPDTEHSVEKAVAVHKCDMSEATHDEPSADMAIREQDTLAWSRIREYCQDGFSEFLGTMVLILFGDGVVAQVVLSKGTKGDYQSISWGWG